MNILYSFILTFLAGLSTLLGFLFVFYKGNISKITQKTLAFAAGVMFCVSIIDLIPESIKLLLKNNSKQISFLLLFIFVILGATISYIIDKILPENDNVKDKKLYKVGIFSMIVIIIHNIPEGIVTFLSSTTNIALGISLTIAIALHNIPEGISISVPIYSASGSKKIAFKYTLISAIAEPLGALIAFLFLKPIITDNIMGCILAIIAGIMTHISLLQLFPTSLKYNKKGTSIIYFFIGIIFMYISLILM